MKETIMLLLLIGITNNIISQQKKYTQEEIDYFVSNDLKESTLGQFKEMLKSDASLIGWVAYYRQKSYVHLIKKENDSVLIYGKKGVKSFDFLHSNHSSKEEVYAEEARLKPIYLYMGIVLAQDKQYRKSTEYLLNAIELINKYPNILSLNNSYVYSYLSSNFLEMGNKKESLKYRLKASKDSVYMRNHKNAAVTYNRLGVVYHILGNKDSAIYYYKKSLKNRIAIKDYAGERSVYNNIGDYYREEKKIDSAIYYYTKSKELLDVYPNKNYGKSKYFTRANYGYVLLKNGEKKKAINTLNTVLDSIKSTDKMDYDFKNLKTITLSYLIEAYQKNGEPDKAIQAANQKNEFLEEFHKQELEEKLRELNVAYKVREKDASIQQLEATRIEQEIIIKQRNFILFVLGGLLLSIIGIGVLFFRQRKLKNKYETANLKQRLLRSQLNPHFVFNSLNTISSLAHKNSDKAASYIAKLGSLIRLVLKNSREEFVSLKDELTCIEDYFELQSNFSQKFTYNIIVDSGIDTEEICIPPMFIQPFIENSIKHGIKGMENGKIQITIKINKKDRLIKCEILDNGIGVVESSKYKNEKYVNHESYSSEILRERLYLYTKSLNKKAKYTLKNMVHIQGTKVDIHLPYIYDL